MRQSRSSLLLAGLLAFCAGTAWASTPDGQTPSRETVCDAEQGAAFGLCNAYCEAMDCDNPLHHASDHACSAVHDNFMERTGRPLPCEVTCPCIDGLVLFRAIVDGTVQVLRCTIDEDAIFVSIDEETFSAVITGPPARCIDNSELNFVDLEPTELQVCRVVLRTASEAQGIPCESPE